MALVGCLTDIGLCGWCSVCLPDELEKYEKQYSRQVEWLEAVQSSAVMLDLPTVTGPNGEEDYHNPIRTGEESETIISGKTWEIKRKETSCSGT